MTEWNKAADDLASRHAADLSKRTPPDVRSMKLTGIPDEDWQLIFDADEDLGLRDRIVHAIFLAAQSRSGITDTDSQFEWWATPNEMADEIMAGIDRDNRNLDAEDLAPNAPWNDTSD